MCVWWWCKNYYLICIFLPPPPPLCPWMPLDGPWWPQCALKRATETRAAAGRAPARGCNGRPAPPGGRRPKARAAAVAPPPSSRPINRTPIKTTTTTVNVHLLSPFFMVYLPEVVQMFPHTCAQLSLEQVVVCFLFYITHINICHLF